MTRSNSELIARLHQLAPLIFWPADVIAVNGGGNPADDLRAVADRLEAIDQALPEGVSVADLAALWDAVWDNDNVMTIVYGAVDADRVIEVDFLRQVRAQRPASETTP